MIRRPFRNNNYGNVPADDPTNSFLTVYSKDYATVRPSKSLVTSVVTILSATIYSNI